MNQEELNLVENDILKMSNKLKKNIVIKEVGYRTNISCGILECSIESIDCETKQSETTCVGEGETYAIRNWNGTECEIITGTCNIA